jgi:hypothetical protein
MKAAASFPKYSTGFLGCLVSGVSTPIRRTLSPLLKIIVSPSTTLVHLRVWEFEQDMDKIRVRKVSKRIFDF